jgi:hypothetical protein
MSRQLLTKAPLDCLFCQGGCADLIQARLSFARETMIFSLQKILNGLLLVDASKLVSLIPWSDTLGYDNHTRESWRHS